MRKVGIRYYTVPEYEEEAKYLSKMHKKGWKFVKYVLPCFYVFEKCEPADVIYQLDYNQDGLRDREAYFQMYRDCGWEHLCDVVGYSYFRKPVGEKHKGDSIFSDDASRLDMINRVYKGRMVPCLVIFFALICPQLVLQFIANSWANRVVFFIYLILFIVYVIMFGKFYFKRYKLRKKMFFKS